MKQAPDPFAPVLRLIVLLGALIFVVLYLTACAAAPASAPAKPAFPDDMRVVCYEGNYWIGSVSADQVVRLPLSCT